MNINELLTKNITIVVAVIIVLIVVSVIITFMLLKVTESKYIDLELQNVRLIEQVKTYTNNLAKLYEEEKMISEEQDDVTQDIPAPDVNKINEMPEMVYQPVQQSVQQPIVQPVQPTVQSVNQPVNQPVQSVDQPVQPTVQSVNQPVGQPVNQTVQSVDQTVQSVIPRIVETTTVQGQHIPPPQPQDVVTVDTTK